ncbi:hypothetical protein AHAS_Ahas19G0100500 [Arachis hypogaea]
MSTRNNPAPKDAAALMMMARTAFYIPKEGPMPSFSLALTDSSQEEALMQEGHGQPGAQKAKSPETPKLIEQLEELSKEMLAEIKEKCYVWATRVKTYGDGSTNEYDPVCTLKAQDRFILSKVHFASLKAATHIEAEIVTAVCLILNQQNVKRFQEEIYCLLPDIVNMAIENHPDGKFLHPKSKKPFKVEDYPMFIPFLDLKKLASHQYVKHWWIWVANVRKKKFYILDPYHKECPSKARMKLNTFVGYIISRMRVYAGAPLRKKDHEIEPLYINISGQKITYDCAIYVMKWLEIIQSENIKREKYELDNWTQIDSYDIDSD